MFFIKKLHLNLLSIVSLLTLKVLLGDNPTRLKTIENIFKLELSKSTLKETGILFSQISVPYQKIYNYQLIQQLIGHVSIARIK